MHRRRTALVISALAASLLLAACGTSTASNAPGDTGSAATPGGQATPAATATVTQGPTATLGNIGGAATGLSNLSSYKVTMSGSGGTGPFSVELIRINGASPALSMTEIAGSVSFRVIEIGTDNWVDTGAGVYVKNSMPSSSLDAMLGAFDPGRIFSSTNASQDLSGLENKGVESKNGVQAIHLHGDSSTPLPAGASPIPAGASVDLWVAADGGYLVALEAVGLSSASGALTSFTIEITNINDPSLTVAPPS